MSITYKLSIAAALVAFGIGPACFAEGSPIPVAGFAPGTMGTGYSRLLFNYDASGKLHVANPESFERGRFVNHRGQDAFAEVGDPPVFSTTRNQSVLSPASLSYEPDLNSH